MTTSLAPFPPVPLAVRGWASSRLRGLALLGAASLVLGGCGAARTVAPADPRVADMVRIDRFGDAFAHAFRRSADNTLPSPGQPIDFDSPRFRNEGYAPNGKLAWSYRLDIASRTPGFVFVLYRRGQSFPVADQLPIVDDLPGDAGYNDLRRAVHVDVPSGYIANLFTSLDDIRRSGATLDTTAEVYNMPLVPAGSTARYRMESGADPSARQAWYRGKVAPFLLFEEPASRPLGLDAAGLLDTCTTFVCFVGDDPARGFMFESDGVRSHNVHTTAPGQGAYTPLSHWVMYPGSYFYRVGNRETAVEAPLGPASAVYENAPIVRVFGLATGN